MCKLTLTCNVIIYARSAKVSLKQLGDNQSQQALQSLVVIDGEKIDYLDRHEVKKLEEDLEQKAESSKQDDYVLQKLFKKSGRCLYFHYLTKQVVIDL